MRRSCCRTNSTPATMQMIVAVTSDAGVHSEGARAVGTDLVAQLKRLAVRDRTAIGLDRAAAGRARRW